MDSVKDLFKYFMLLKVLYCLVINLFMRISEAA